MRRKSKTALGDRCMARRRFFRIMATLSDLGAFISQSSPSMSTSGVRTHSSSLLGTNLTSYPAAARAGAVPNPRGHTLSPGSIVTLPAQKTMEALVELPRGWYSSHDVSRLVDGSTPSDWRQRWGSGPRPRPFFAERGGRPRCAEGHGGVLARCAIHHNRTAACLKLGPAAGAGWGWRLAPGGATRGSSPPRVGPAVPRVSTRGPRPAAPEQEPGGGHEGG